MPKIYQVSELKKGVKAGHNHMSAALLDKTVGVVFNAVKTHTGPTSRDYLKMCNTIIAEMKKISSGRWSCIATDKNFGHSVHFDPGFCIYIQTEDLFVLVFRA